jgi:2-hydroxy-3-keto-5-methylthiopentenyl-1-phosphate phosphatase
MKAGDMDKLASVANKGEEAGITSEELVYYFTAHFSESEMVDLEKRVLEKKISLNETLETLTMDELERDIAVTAYAILLVLQEMKK